MASNTPAADRRLSLCFGVLCLIGNIGVIALVYWDGIHSPLLQDDWFFWWHLKGFSFSGYADLYLFPEPGRFYRPLGAAYLAAAFTTFGHFYLLYKLVSVLLLALSALMLSQLVLHFCHNRWAAVLSGCVYLSAYQINGEMLYWAVGVFDLGANFFLFSALLLALKRRYGISLVLYTVATLFKESTVLAGFVFAAYVLLDRPQSPARRRIALGYVLVSMVALIIRVWALGDIATDSGSPYQVDISVANMLEKLAKYLYVAANWGAIPPFPTAVVSVLLLVAIAWMGVQIVRGSDRVDRLLVLSVAISTLLPVIVLGTHFFAYFLSFAFGALCVLVWPPQVGNRLWVFGLVCVVFVAIGLVTSYRVTVAAEAGRTILHGSNHLALRSRAVEAWLTRYNEQLDEGKRVTCVRYRSGEDHWGLGGQRAWHVLDPTIQVLTDDADAARDCLQLDRE